jgi:hypothetical protein
LAFSEFRHQIAEAYADGLDELERSQLAGMKRRTEKVARRERW